MAPTPNSALLAAHLREDTADLLALLPAARRAAAGGPGGGEATLDGIARAAYRTLRTAENLAAHAALCTAPPHPQPVCVTALAAAYVSGAARGNAASHCGRQRPGMRALRRGPRPGPWA